jgi:prepilin-type N-terminal cleavage/methylation domain-containing protein
MRQMLGHTLIELMMVLAILGVVLALAAPQALGWRDRIAVDRASAEIASFYDLSRYAAIVRATRVRLEFAPDSLRAAFEGVSDSALRERPGPARLGVALRVSRRVIRVGPTGLGWGAANTTLVLTRGAAAETLTTSRLGRIKRWR